MTFKIIGTEMGSLVLSEKDRKIGVPDIDTLFDVFYNKHLTENFTEHVKGEPARCEKIVSKVVDAIAENESKKYQIVSILANHKKNAFTVTWADGTHTIVHCQPGDDWDDEKALAMCFTKKALGNKGNFNDKFNDALDNKMKVIPADPAPEKACDCDGTCEECECEKAKEKVTKMQKAVEELRRPLSVSKETADELAKATTKADVALKKMIDALIGEDVKVPPLEGHYRVFIRIGGVSHHDSDFTSVPALRNRIHQIAEELYGREPYYYRTWMNGDRMVIDFGHHTQFIEVEGITPDEYAKN